MKETKKQQILDEQYYPYLFMSKSERDFCLKVLNNCKDINDSNHKINNIGKCQIVEMSFKKENGIIRTTGSLIIGDGLKKECRTMEADIYIKKDNIIVDMLITRLNSNDKNRQYRVLDEFKLENDILKRRSQYNYDMKNIYEVVENEEMKGRLK